MSRRTLHVVLSCEHGGNRIPPEYASLFRRAQKALNSHRGYDPGSLEIGRYFARRLNAPLHAANVSRLLVELNRSVGHPKLFSEFTTKLDNSARRNVLDEYYFPHRQTVEENLGVKIRSGQRAVHLSVHTFTPVMNGQKRNADVGLLYDPARPGERQFCDLWRRRLLAENGNIRVRRNYPYLGRADGFTTHLRKQFTDRDYIGIELEVNQVWVFDERRRSQWRGLIQTLAESFAGVCDEFGTI